MSKKGVIIAVLFTLILGTVAGMGVVAVTSDNGENSAPLIPELTKREEATAIEITLSDMRIQELLEGKRYKVAPDGNIGVWHSTADKDLMKIGASLEIRFEQAYQIEYNWPFLSYDEAKYSWPYYQESTFYYTLQVESLFVSVDLNKGKVVGIVPIEDRELS